MDVASFVSNAVAQCKSAEHFTSIKMSLHPLIAEAVAAGDLTTRNWAEVPLPSFEDSLPAIAQAAINDISLSRDDVTSSATLALAPTFERQSYLCSNGGPSGQRAPPTFEHKSYLCSYGEPSGERDSYAKPLVPIPNLPLSSQEAPHFEDPSFYPKSVHTSSTTPHFLPPGLALKQGTSSASTSGSKTKSIHRSSKQEGEPLNRKDRKNSVTEPRAIAGQMSESQAKQCSLCDIRCSTLKIYEDHLKSKLHQKRCTLQRNGMASDAKTVRAISTSATSKCTLCNLDCGTTKSLAQHLKAKRHLNMVKAKAQKHLDTGMLQNHEKTSVEKYMAAPRSAIYSNVAISAEKAPTKTILDRPHLVDDSANIAFQATASPLMASSSGLGTQSIPYATTTLWGETQGNFDRNSGYPSKTHLGNTNSVQAALKFRCHVCHVNCLSAKHFQSHLKGKKHTKNISSTSGIVANQTVTVPLARLIPPQRSNLLPPPPPALEGVSFLSAPPPPPTPPASEWAAFNTSPPPQPLLPPPLPPVHGRADILSSSLPPHFAPEKVLVNTAKSTAVTKPHMKKAGMLESCSTSSDMSIDDDLGGVEQASANETSDAREFNKRAAAGDTGNASALFSHSRSPATRHDSERGRLPASSHYGPSYDDGQDFRRNRSRSPPYAYRRRYDDSPPNRYRRRSRSPYYSDRGRWNVGNEWS